MRYRKTFQVSSHDVDINNHIKPSSLQRFMMETAMCQMRDRRPSYGELYAKEQAFILTRVTIEILQQIEQFVEIEVQTWNCPARGVTFVRCFEVYCQEKLMARAHTVWGVVHPRTGKLWKSSQVDISNYEAEEPLEMMLPTRFRLDRDLEFFEMGIKKVHYGEIDMNMHMNNTYYSDVLWSYVPDIMEKEVTSLCLRYHAEAPLGAQWRIWMGKPEVPALQDSQAEETYCFKTTVGDRLNVEAIIGVRKTTV